MTQFYNSNSSTLASEKRAFGMPVSSNKNTNGSNSQVSQKIKNFFRISSGTHDGSQKEVRRSDVSSSSKSDNKSSLRQSRFIPHLGRNRSTTVVSEGNPLDDSLSPTAHANPYFQHQGPPALRHHNDASVPPSPPDTPQMRGKLNAASGANDHQIAAGKEELARKLRRVASAPNTHLLGESAQAARPDSASSANPIANYSNLSSLSIVENASAPSGNLLPVPPVGALPTPGQIRQSVAFRRTYSSNSIKIRNVEVGPSSFDKIKLIGKGDVGKVYLVREKKSTRLYAMKGRVALSSSLKFCSLIKLSSRQEGDD